jgi:replicative DNA helicase
VAEYSGVPVEMLGINLPFSIEAEQAVLGAVIVDSRALYDIMPIISADNFYSRVNREIYQEMVLMFSVGKPIDFVTVLDAVKAANIFENEQEAKRYLFEMAETVPTISNVASYAKIVYDKYLLRALITASKDIMHQASESQDNASTLLDLAEQKIYEIRSGKSSSELCRIDTALFETLDYLNKLSGPDRHKLIGLSTGFRHLDRLITGLNKADLIILAARPSIGKTSFALNIATNVSKNYPDKAVVMFSLEMTQRQLVARVLSSEANVPSQAFRTGELAPADWIRIAEVTDPLAKSNLYFDDTSGISVQEIKAKSRRVKNLGLIIVDYLQLMSSPGRSESRVQEISNITRAFKIMAKELDVPIILLSQLSRSNEKQRRRPMLSDLRDSGSIEQDADIVMFLHRDLDEEGDESEANKNEVLLMVLKNRNGEVANISLQWDGQHTKFTSTDFRFD